MPGYSTVDLAPFVNVDRSILPERESIPDRDQSYHGLPFLIGDGSGQVAGFGEGVRMEPIDIPIARTITYAVFAHRLIDSRVLEGGTPVGVPCAEYVFRYDDGTEERTAIRDRFEIGTVPAVWGQWAMLAKADVKDYLMPREIGRFGDFGVRQVEAQAGWPQAFYIYYWRNPHPDRIVVAIRIEPKGPRFTLGGLTLSDLEETPLVRAAKVPVKITLTRPEDAAREGNLEIEVDRGLATFPYALPSATLEEFLASGFAGWGEEQNPRVSPSFVEIAANPSATVTIGNAGETLAAVNWGEIESKGAVETDRVRVEFVDSGRNWVRTTVVDDETGQPIPCRIHFRSAAGIPAAPHSHHPHVNHNLNSWNIDVGGDLRLGQISYAYIDGTCEGWLPRGDVVVDVAKGFEYHPLREKITIAPGQQELTLRLKRMTNLADRRYYSGDTHVHFISTQGAHLEAAAEGLSVVNLLLSQWGHVFTNTEEFTGAPSVCSRNGTIVYASQENRQHILGHISLLGLKKPVHPWCTGGPDESLLGDNLETTLARWADECRAQGGTVVLPHIPTPNGEPAALIATGRVDAVEMLVQGKYMHEEYYRYLNCGYRLPLVGGTDKMSSDIPVGMYRTYVHLAEDEELTYDNWCRALRRGNTFHSGGPLLNFSVEGRSIGDTIHLPEGGGTLEVECSAVSVLPFHCIEILLNGNVVDRVEETNPVRSLSLHSKVRVDRNSWIAARCSGPNYYDSTPHFDCWRRGLMAHTSPVYIAAGSGDWWMFDYGTANYMLTLIGASIEHIHHHSSQWKPGTVTHHHGHDKHLEYLEEPFREATQAIHRRMHELGIPH